MEDIDILKKFDNAKLIDIVKNHQRYGYDDELRDSAICLLEERGWSREELQQFGYLTNHNYEEAKRQYKAYNRNSLIGICVQRRHPGCRLSHLSNPGLSECSQILQDIRAQ